ncbi:MAG: extracellular solute-binding protein [Lachnospiraceae bacterium]|nr:extracellular solute-binding protein [Lachnospiraceae bacterium]
MGKKTKNRFTAFLALTAMIVTGQPATPSYAQTDVSLEEYEDIVGTYSIDDSMLSYEEYLAQYNDVRPDAEIVVDAADYARYTDGSVDESGNEVYSKPEVYTDYEGETGDSVLIAENGMIEFDITVTEEGFYDMSLDYFPVAGNSSDIQRAFFVDGKLLYNELAMVEFQRVWQNTVLDLVENEDGIQVKNWVKDNQNNDLKPSMEEAPRWMTSYLYDSEGYITSRLSMYLTAGEHTVTMVSLREPMLLRRVRLDNPEEVKSYADKKSEWDAAGATATSGKSIRIEAENAARTSSQMLYPTQDQSSPALYPSSAKELLNNAIGGNSWRLVNQWIEWDFEVPESGYYNISMHTRQNFVKGFYVSRKITIDGEVPFEELEDYGFSYEQTWRMETLADSEGNDFMIYLEAGKHTLRMQTVLGEFSDIISEVEDCMAQLNAIYRKIIRITGVSPDSYRDYQIESSLPELNGELVAVRDQLNNVIKDLRAATGKKSDKETALITMRDQLDELIEDGEYFVKVISSYKTNVRALGTWVTSALEQPMQLDTIYVHSADVEVEVENSNFWSRLLYELTRLYYSFVIDYNQIGNVAAASDRAITLWVGSGRDQANVIKALVDKTFTNKSGISVNVMIVDMGTLLQATLAGQGPDVAIQVGNDLPMNYGLRDAVLDLSQFADLGEVTERFYDSAMVPFEFDGATYALPETQTFPMMFYRKDILKELNLDIPTTWEEVKVVMTVLSKNQMEIGMLPGENIFAMLLYQNGGEYYNADGSRSALNSDQAVNAFKEYCEFYTDYKIDQSTNVEERFRTGEAPIIIADYTLYNNLQVSAPDIKGLWGIAPVPGTYNEEADELNNVVGSSGQACVVMKDTEDPEASWEFLKWWTSAETQIAYGKEMESLMGSAARIATANIKAFEALPWPNAEREALMEQFEKVKGIPQVPGGYFSWRNVNNAFYKVTTESDSTSPREELMDKVILIDAEIDYKREEFDLPLYVEEE